MDGYECESDRESEWHESDDDESESGRATEERECVGEAWWVNLSHGSVGVAWWEREGRCSCTTR